MICIGREQSDGVGFVKTKRQSNEFPLEAKPSEDVNLVPWFGESHVNMKARNSVITLEGRTRT